MLADNISQRIGKMSKGIEFCPCGKLFHLPEIIVKQGIDIIFIIIKLTEIGSVSEVMYRADNEIIVL